MHVLAIGTVAKKLQAVEVGDVGIEVGGHHLPIWLALHPFKKNGAVFLPSSPRIVETLKTVAVL